MTEQSARDTILKHTLQMLAAHVDLSPAELVQLRLSNLHLAGKEIAPKAGYPSTGSADLCFLVDSPVDRSISIIEGKGVSIIHGPVLREGAAGPINSVYIRDPDLNLIEVSFPA